MGIVCKSEGELDELLALRCLAPYSVVLEPGTCGKTGHFLTPCVVERDFDGRSRMYFAHLGGDAVDGCAILSAVLPSCADTAGGPAPTWTVEPSAVHLTARSAGLGGRVAGPVTAVLCPEVVSVARRSDGRAQWFMFFQVNGARGFAGGSAVMAAHRGPDETAWTIVPGFCIGPDHGVAAFGSPRLLPQRTRPTTTTWTLCAHRYVDPMTAHGASIVAVPVSGLDDPDPHRCLCVAATAVSSGSSGSGSSSSGSGSDGTTLLTARGDRESFAIYAPEFVRSPSRVCMLFAAWAAVEPVHTDGPGQGSPSPRTGQICAAVSHDGGVTFERVSESQSRCRPPGIAASESAVIVAPGGPWARAKVSEPSCVRLGGRWRILVEGCGDDGTWRILDASA
jgi:hypothetical protein